jgi:hypothetical protein
MVMVGIHTWYDSILMFSVILLFDLFGVHVLSCIAVRYFDVFWWMGENCYMVAFINLHDLLSLGSRKFYIY